MDPQIAEARCTRMNSAFDETFVAQVAVGLQPIEHGLDLGVAVSRQALCARVVAAGVFTQAPQQLAAQLQAAVLALRKPLKRLALE